MKAVSFHSHKGGAGKTTLMACLARKLQVDGKKVCMVDLDFIGSGLERLLFISGKRISTINEFFFEGERWSPKDIRRKLIRKPSFGPEKADAQNVGLIINQGNLEDEGNLRRKLLDLSAASVMSPWLLGRLESLLKALSGIYDYVLFDCHPGIFGISEIVLFWEAIQTRVFVSRPDVTHISGTIVELARLAREKKKIGAKPGAWFLVTNCAPPKIMRDFDDLQYRLKIDGRVNAETSPLFGMPPFRNKSNEQVGELYGVFDHQENIAELSLPGTVNVKPWPKIFSGDALSKFIKIIG